MSKTKRVHNNGVYVGDIVTTGDDMKDAMLVQKLLASKGISAPAPTPVQSIFSQAGSFINISADIFEKHLNVTPPNGSAMAPFVVNTAFGIELLLKTLALQHGKTLHGHELTKLFRKLPSAAREDIRQQFYALAPISQWASAAQTIEDLHAVFDELDTAFVDWRYLHENIAKPLRVTFKPTIFLAEILHAACAKNNAAKSADSGTTGASPK